MKSLSSCCSFLSYPLFNTIHINSSFIMYFEETFVNTCQLHACCSLKLYHRSFQLHVNLCYFRINCGAAIY